ncbi:MAG: beta-N-acetylhexosaminidase [Alphaproteobacteria bacterium]
MAGERLSPDEKRFSAACDPLGFVLFRRNCVSREQVRDLVAEMREAVGRADAPVLIDQEGGRVARLRPPEWRAYPAPAKIAALPDPTALEAAYLAARLIAEDLAELGVTVDAAPVLDLPVPGADPVIGDRAWGTDPARVAALGRAVCDGLLDGGVLPIIKHIPGHGRARVDSHTALPRVDDDGSTLSRADFAPFRALADMPWAMTAHIVYTKIDDAAPATLSRIVIDDVIRGEIGFDGVLVSDDISMGALAGSFAERTRRALDAGCDLVLHCNGDMAEMEAVAAAARPLSAEVHARIARAEELRQSRRVGFDARGAERRFAELISGGPATSSKPA